MRTKRNQNKNEAITLKQFKLWENHFLWVGVSGRQAEKAKVNHTGLQTTGFQVIFTGMHAPEAFLWGTGWCPFFLNGWNFFFHFLHEMGFLACIIHTLIEIIGQSSQELLYSPHGTAPPSHLLWRSGVTASGPAPTSLTLKLLSSFQSSLARSGVRSEMTLPEQKRERMVSVVLQHPFHSARDQRDFLWALCCILNG